MSGCTAYNVLQNNVLQNNVLQNNVLQNNVLQNNGMPAHQAVFHVHFHIIPKPDEDTGLGIGWPATQLADGEPLAKAIAAAVEE